MYTVFELYIYLHLHLNLQLQGPDELEREGVEGAGGHEGVRADDVDDDDLDAGEDEDGADHDHDDYRGYAGVGGDESSVARGGDQGLGPLC